MQLENGKGQLFFNFPKNILITYLTYLVISNISQCLANLKQSFSITKIDLKHPVHNIPYHIAH